MYYILHVHVVYIELDSQSLVFSDGESGDRDIGEEVDAVRGLVARLTLRASCSDHEWSSPVAASLSRVVTQDGHTNQLEQRGGRERGGRCEREAVSIRHIFNLYFDV